MPGRIRNSVLICLVLFFATSLVAEVKALKNFTLIDGTGGPPLAHAAMIIDAGRILWVGPVSQLKTPASAQVIDLQGKYVMPGIINLHVHLGATIGLDQSAENFTPQNVEKDLKTYASYGVFSAWAPIKTPFSRFAMNSAPAARERLVFTPQDKVSSSRAATAVFRGWTRASSPQWRR
jgi:hypothetical protein